MKKLILPIIVLLSVVLCSCSAKPYYNSPDEVTARKIQERLAADTILNEMGGVKISVSNVLHTVNHTSEFTKIYSKENGTRQTSITYTSPMNYTAFASDDPNDRYFYIFSDEEMSATPMTDDVADELLFGYVFIFPVDEITNFTCEKAGENFVANVEYEDAEYLRNIEFTIDAKSGFPVNIQADIKLNGEKYNSITYMLEYSKDFKADTTARDAIGRPSAKLTFESTDINGEPIDDSIIAGYKLVMLNFWEPWCGPCVGEMPDIQKLYEEYKDDGLLVIGVYSTEKGTDTVAQQNGITYPLVKHRPTLTQFTSDYVPTTVFFDGEGNQISEQHIGAKKYEDWEKIVKQYLN